MSLSGDVYQGAFKTSCHEQELGLLVTVKYKGEPQCGGREMTQQLRARTALPEDLCSIPSTQVRCLPKEC